MYKVSYINLVICSILSVGFGTSDSTGIIISSTGKVALAPLLMSSWDMKWTSIST